MVPTPDTIEEKVQQIWFYMVGMNGDGMISKVNRINEKVENIESSLPQFVTRAEIMAEQEKRKTKKTVGWQFWIGIGIALVSSIVNAILLAVLT